jgi:hypothetical protein
LQGEPKQTFAISAKYNFSLALNYLDEVARDSVAFKRLAFRLQAINDFSKGVHEV